MEVKNDYRQTYHANIPAAWANDPNGLIWYQGKVHLFCQYYPYKPQWGQMHWGHFVSEDLIRWEFLETALIPDQDYETICGCCSGSHADRSHRPDDDKGRESRAVKRPHPSFFPFGERRRDQDRKRHGQSRRCDDAEQRVDLVCGIEITHAFRAEIRKHGYFIEQADDLDQDRGNGQ